MKKESRPSSEISATFNGLPSDSFVLRYHGVLLKHALKYANTVEAAEDLVQDAYLFLVRSGMELETDLDVLRYLKWKIRLLAVDVWRLAGSKVERVSEPLPEEHRFSTSEAGGGIEPESTIMRAEQTAVVSLALSRVPARQRYLLLESSRDELATDDLALRMNLSQGALRQLLLRARKSFVRELQTVSEEKGYEVHEILPSSFRHRFFAKGVATLSIALVALAGSLTLMFMTGSFNDAQTSLRAETDPASELTAAPDSAESDGADLSIITDEKFKSVDTGVNEPDELLAGIAGDLPLGDNEAAQASSKGTSVSEAGWQLPAGTTPALEVALAPELSPSEEELSTLKTILLESVRQEVVPVIGQTITQVNASACQLDFGSSLQVIACSFAGASINAAWRETTSPDFAEIFFLDFVTDSTTYVIAPRSTLVISSQGASEEVKLVNIFGSDISVGDLGGNFGSAVVQHQDFSDAVLFLSMEIATHSRELVNVEAKLVSRETYLEWVRNVS